MYYLEAKQFPSVKELLDFYNKSQLPVSTSGALLIKPVIKYDKWQLQLNEIKKIQNLGKGEFGEVYEAEWNGQRVAVKTCHSTCVMDKDKFFKEVEILKQHDHPNIIKLIGYCWNTEPLIVMELMTGGSLLNFLKKNSCNSKEKLLHMAIDACSGMAYLEKKSCIHRDLAARNCLVRDNEIVKISDFGMSHDDCVLYQMQGIKPIPIKWTAPEVRVHLVLYAWFSICYTFSRLFWAFLIIDHICCINVSNFLIILHAQYIITSLHNMNNALLVHPYINPFCKLCSCIHVSAITV